MKILHAFLVLFTIGVFSTHIHCIEYFIMDKNVAYVNANITCDAAGSNSQDSRVATQCAPNNLSKLIFSDQSYNKKKIWIDLGKACVANLCPALVVNTTREGMTAVECVKCTDFNPILCQSNVVPTISVDMVTVMPTPGDPACNMSWIQHDKKEYQVVSTLMSMRDSRTYCFRSHRAILMDAQTAQTGPGFLQLSSNIPCYWISVPGIYDPSQGYCLQPNGTVTRQSVMNVYGSICQRLLVSTTVQPAKIPALQTSTQTTSDTQLSFQTSPSLRTSPTKTTMCDTLGAFIHDTTFDDHIGENRIVVDTLIIQNIIVCSRNCMNNPGCQAFIFVKKKSLCQLHTVKGSNLQRLALGEYSEYYIRH